ncbi:hypothetical protein C1H46_001599 [Malus baccata]|uniref:non-specific serine/threonine protein kinase n=1 Tax=Malus baccata TaxID=106549 RepID=A0A540NNV5_MALBA|nr:hypothetical protein C1H46_001599 [Malus baccata]
MVFLRILCFLFAAVQNQVASLVFDELLHFWTIGVPQHGTLGYFGRFAKVYQLYHHGLFRKELGRIYAAEIVSAVAHLHANGIMHRDLKPENILLDADGHAMLTDFGLAKQLEENTRSNSMCGTVEYMPPEIVLGKGHDKAADWWSVGVLLFEMLTGKPHFTGNREKIQQKIVKEKIKLPSFLSSEAHSLLKALLQKDPTKRLGRGPLGSEDIKRPKWFKPINWKKKKNRRLGKSNQAFAQMLPGGTALPILISARPTCQLWIPQPLARMLLETPSQAPLIGLLQSQTGKSQLRLRGDVEYIILK